MLLKKKKKKKKFHTGGNNKRNILVWRLFTSLLYSQCIDGTTPHDGFLKTIK